MAYVCVDCMKIPIFKKKKIQFFFLKIENFFSKLGKSHLNSIGTGAEFQLLRSQKNPWIKKIAEIDCKSQTTTTSAKEIKLAHLISCLSLCFSHLTYPYFP